jgi:hypothetical protein
MPSPVACGAVLTTTSVCSFVAIHRHRKSLRYPTS